MPVKPRRGRPPKVRPVGKLYFLPIKQRTYAFLLTPAGKLRSWLKSKNENQQERMYARKRVAEYLKEE